MNRFNTMKPRAVEAYLRETVRRLFGDSVENDTAITSSHGYYSVEIEHEKIAYSMGNFRKRDVPRIVKTLKFLAGE